MDAYIGAAYLLKDCSSLLAPVTAVSAVPRSPLPLKSTLTLTTGVHKGPVRQILCVREKAQTAPRVWR